MTAYRFRAALATALFALLVFSVLAFGAVETWTLTVLEVGVFLLAAVCLLRIAAGPLRPVWNPLYVPWGAIVVWTAVQWLGGLSVYRYRTQASAWKWLALWLILVIASHIFVDESIRSRFNTALVWFGLSLCMFGLVQYFTAPRTIYWSIPVPVGKVFGPFINGNHFSAFMELIVPSALVLSLRPSDRRLVYAVAWSVMLAAVVVCASRAGTVLVALETVIVLAVMAVSRRRSRTRKDSARLLLPIAGLAAAAMLCFYVAGTQRTLERFEEQHPYSVRWNVARATWQLFRDRPWTGFGAGTFELVYPSAAVIDQNLSWPHAHNDPLEFMMEWGVCAIGLLVSTLALLFSRRWPREIWLTAVLPLTAVLVHSWFDFPLQIPAVMAGWLVLLGQLNPANPQQAEHLPARPGARKLTAQSTAPAARTPVLG